MARGSHFAFDRASSRTTDRDGRLHVAVNNISKACVNGYYGREVPNGDALGLNPDKLYMLLRPPEELSKAAPTFNSLPLLARHVPVSAEDHRPDDVVGATGSNARFNDPFLQNSLVIWAQMAIDGVTSGRQEELSCAYRYDCIMGAGTFNGARYDAKMINIVGNHLAVVPEGRAGKDVIVGDGMSRRTPMQQMLEEFPHMNRLSR